MKCKKCGQEVDKKAVICTGCGCKIKKPIYKKWWFWLLIVVIIIIAGSSSQSNETTVNEPTTIKTSEEIIYEIVDLQVLFDELNTNAMKAESNYQNKHVQFECKINSFDSDGTYIAVEPVNASEWNFITSNCYIKNDVQKSFLLEKSVGDIVTIKGKIKSIGEILGYSIDIAEVY